MTDVYNYLLLTWVIFSVLFPLFHMCFHDCLSLHRSRYDDVHNYIESAHLLRTQGSVWFCGELCVSKVVFDGLYIK